MKLNKDNFAQWFMETVKHNVIHYTFDCFYDIRSIMKGNEDVLEEALQSNNRSFPTERPLYHTFYWFVRDTGTDICEENKPSMELHETYLKNNKYAYELQFCLNSDYFRDEEYCTIKKLK